MGYQALLFCPDEKTARTVTQVLSELDFAVVPCTEPFAAVKKLMGEHFDAVVVDCDNEQNATLLFKSARNSPNNHSALAVAVVEGQAGVAKAFRIGANLVLTKPVNVEQAKGTLRVARGLLRKSEAAKPATGAANTATKPAVPVAAPAARTNPVVSATNAAAPLAPLVAAAASVPTQKPAMQPSVTASVASESDADTEVLETGSDDIGSPSLAIGASAVKIAASKPESLSSTAGHSASSFGTSSASAPAPAREKPSVATESKSSTVFSEPEVPVEKVAAGGSSASAEKTAVPAPSVTLGGIIKSGSESAGTQSAETQSAGSGSKKILLAVAAVALVAAGGYEAWTLLGHGNASAPAHVAASPATSVAKVTNVTKPSAPAPVAATSGTSSGTSAAVSSTSEAAESSVTANKVAKAPAVKAAATPIAIKSGSSRRDADAPAPSMAGISLGGNSVALPSMMGSGKASAPVLQDLHVSQGVSRGLLVKEIAPAYPAMAKQMRVEGAVELLATVSKNGDISAVKVLSGDAQLSHAAVDAVKQWKYKPYLLNGEPVEIQTQVSVKFKLPR
jgi:TonB family protein